MSRYVLALLLFTISSSTAQAQKTSVDHSPLKVYQSAIDLYDQKKYAAAQSKFDEVLEYNYGASKSEFSSLVINSTYYFARCAQELNNLNAPKLLEDFIEAHSLHPLQNLAQFHLGRYYYRNSKYRRAILPFKKVEIYNLTNPQIIELKFKLGYCYFNDKDFSKAREQFDQLKNIKSKYYYPVNYYYGYISYYEKDYDEALSRFQTAENAKMYKKMVPYYITQIYFLKGQYEKLIKYATPILEAGVLQFQNELNYLIGQSYFMNQQYDKAIPYLYKHVNAGRNLSKHDHYQLAYANYMVGDYQEAIKFFQKYSNRKDSLSQHASYILGDCYIRTGEKKYARNAFQEAANMNFDQEIKEIAHFNYAKLSFELEFHKEAIYTTEEFIKNYPASKYNEQAKELLTDIFLVTRNYKDAVSVIESMSSLSPKLKEAYQKVAYYRGIELHNTRKYLDAIIHFDKSLKQPIDPALQALAYFWKGEALIKKGVYKTAIKSFTRYLSLAAIIEDLPFESSIVAAHYNLGYCYLKEDNFSSALTYFQKSTKLAEQSKVQYKSHKLYNLVYSDAVIRSADCHFMLNNYNNALTNYFRVVNNNFPGADYSLYQIGVLYGLANNDAKKISNLERLLTEHRKSLFVDDALFELGNTYLVSDDLTAIKYYNRILSDHPQSTYVSKALLQLGSAYLNLEDNDKALEYYTQVVTEYSATPEAQVALLGVWDIAISTSDPQIYIDLLESVPGMNITISAEDSINYHAAEMRYRKGDCENAVKDLTNYINKFPNGFFANNAHFYRGECLFNDNDFLGALKDYEYVADQVRNRFSENALLKVASIYFYKMTDYKHAFENYLQLLYIADYRANSLTALVGLMRSAYHLKEHEDVVKYATQILDFSQATQMDIAEANLYLGKTAMETGDYEAAIVNFTKTAESTTTEFGVEARYLIALVQYRRLEYKASQATCFIIINHIPSYEELVIKSFILLADNYLALGEVFQAKATLQSIIDNYQGEELKQVAIDKLNAILEKERQEAEEIDTGEDDNFIYEEDSIYFEPDSLYFNFEGIEIDNDSTETDDD